MFEAILWAGTGALLYRFLATMMAVGHASIFANKIIKQTLFLLGSAASDVAFIKELKNKVAHEALTPEQAEWIKKVDDKLFEDWKANSIQMFHNAFTGNTSSLVKFRDWKEAMTYLDKEIKENK
jgi:hypothetical protein